MKNLLLTLLILTLTCTAEAQYTKKRHNGGAIKRRATSNWIGLRAGFDTALPKFVDSNGQKDEGLKGKTGFLASILFQRDWGQKPGYFRAVKTYSLMTKLGYKKINMSSFDNGILSNWTMNYVSSSATFRYYRKYSESSINPFAGVGLGLDYLLSGVDQYDLTFYDLTDFMKRTNIGVVIEAGVTYPLTNKAYGSVELAYIHNINNLSLDDQQEMNVSTLELTVTLLFAL